MNAIKTYTRANPLIEEVIEEKMKDYIKSNVDGPVRCDVGYPEPVYNCMIWLYYYKTFNLHQELVDIYNLLDDIDGEDNWKSYKSRIKAVGEKVYEKTFRDCVDKFSDDKIGLQTIFYIICNFSGMKDIDNHNEIRFAYKDIEYAFAGIGSWR